MAGVAGMASPKKAQASFNPEEPDMSELADVSAAPVAQAAPSEPEFDYEAWAQEQVTQTEPSQNTQPFDYDAWAKSQVAQEAAPSIVPEEITSEQPGALQRISEIPSRAKASFAITDRELMQSLKQSFGDKNVRKSGGYSNEIEYKGSDGKWRVWDQGTTVEDFTVDLARPILEEVPASAATIAAAIPAVASTAATFGVTAPVSAAGVAAARAGGALVGQGLADVTQSMLGIERDPNRNAALEYGATAILAPAAGALADFATKKIAQRAASAGAKKLMAPDALYKEEISGIKEALDVVKQTGGMENLPGTNTPVMLYHLNPSNPVARQLTENASSLKGYAQMEEQLVQSFDKSNRNFFETLGNINPDNMKSGQVFKSHVQEAIKKEGAAIGGVRQALIDASGTGELPIPSLKGKLEGFAKEIGFNIDGETNISGLKNFLVEEQGYSKQAADVIVNKTNKMLERVTNKEGRMTAKELVGAYEEVNGLYKNIMAGGQETSPLFRQKIGEMRRFFADELIDKSEVILDKQAKAGYVQNLKNYQELVNSSSEFSNLLDKNNLASHSLSRSIFSKGANGLDSAEAVKVLLRDRPDLLNDVKGSFLQDVISKSPGKIGGTDWVKVNKTLSDPELRPVINSMFGENAPKVFKAYETLGRSIQNGNIGSRGTSTRANFLKNLTEMASVSGAANKGVDLISQVDPDKALAQIVSKEGIDNFLKTVPKDKKPLLKKMLDGIVSISLRGAQVSEIPLRRTGKNMSVENANEINMEEQNP